MRISLSQGDLVDMLAAGEESKEPERRRRERTMGEATEDTPDASKTSHICYHKGTWRSKTSILRALQCPRTGVSSSEAGTASQSL